VVQVGLNKNGRPYLQITKAKRNWQCSSSGRVPAQQLPGLELKPEYHQKKNKNKPTIGSCIFFETNYIFMSFNTKGIL
jgi:hypothetical protein